MINPDTSSSLEVGTLVDSADVLRQAITDQWHDLLTSIRVQVWKFGLASDRPQVEGVAQEVLQNTIVTALRRADIYDPNRPALAWLRGIALNEIRTLKRTLQMERQRILPVADALQAQKARGEADGALTEDDMYDLLMNAGSPNERHKPTLDDLLSLVDGDDRQVLVLAFGEGLQREELAAVLGISLGTAWSRVSRAIKRLSRAYRESERPSGEGK